jgi:hypothetical protein
VLAWRDIKLEPEAASGGHCDCCGGTTCRVWGFAYHDGNSLGAYYVTWAIGRPDHGARVDLVLGHWGDGTTAKDRYVVSMDYRVAEPGGPAFMVIDAQTGSLKDTKLADVLLSRKKIIGTPLATQVFTIVDAIWMKDGRVAEVVAWR